LSGRARIVVCDDDADMRDMLHEFLTEEGYDVELATGGADLRRVAPAFRPDLVICDLRMPGEDGLSLTRWMRAEAHCAVLMLTGMGGVVARVIGLEMGADDYLAKPFEPAELRARIKAILRRTMTADLAANGRPPARVRVGKCIVDLERRTMFGADGVKVPLTSMEFDLLHTLIVHARRVLSRDQLLEMAHHQRWDPFDRSIDIRIARLRKKIELDPAKPAALKTVRGEGYMLIPAAD
jgi:DNA-binding response OmpR family regulator